MVRKVTPSELQNRLRQMQNKYNQAVDKYNREARAAAVKINQARRQVVNQYNQQVRAHNNAVTQQRQRIQNALQRLRSLPATTRYVSLRVSAQSLHTSFSRLEAQTPNDVLPQHFSLDLAERETANSIDVVNALEGLPSDEAGAELVADNETVENLRAISDDLDRRWRGAIFSLNVKNPDAARHFCTSAREIFTKILELKISEEDVLRGMPNCAKMNNGKPTRRTKIQYALKRKQIESQALEDFVEEDIENILQLFQLFNDATHGTAGTYSLQQLGSIKRRVENGIAFFAAFLA